MKKNLLVISSFAVTVVITYCFIFASLMYEGRLQVHAQTDTTHVLGEKTNDQHIVSPLATTVTISPSPIATVTATASITPTSSPSAVSYHQTWSLQSVSAMKVTKDLVCQQKSEGFIEQWVDTAKELGVNYISIETPYDSPSCGDALNYTKLWVSVIRSRGLHVWHRHMFTSFEGIYSTIKDPNKNYLQLMADYIKTNPELFAPDDIFTPTPEPQNGGINGVTQCTQDICMFSSAKQFNQWLRDAIDSANSAFASIGLKGKIKVGYYGFDGFVAWGNNNPQWKGILEEATVQKMGNITIDHYPEAVGDTMAEDLDKLQKKYPKIDIVIGEWGTITPSNEVQQVINTMTAAKRKNVVGFNYWQMSNGGNEDLVNDDFSHRPTFASVENFYKVSNK